jgi:hypothetical protein
LIAMPAAALEQVPGSIEVDASGLAGLLGKYAVAQRTEDGR